MFYLREENIILLNRK